MKNSRGFIDPMTLGFLLSLIGTTTVFVTHDTDVNEKAVDTIIQVDAPKITATEMDDDFGV